MDRCMGCLMVYMASVKRYEDPSVGMSDDVERRCKGSVLCMKTVVCEGD